MEIITVPGQRIEMSLARYDA